MANGNSASVLICATIKDENKNAIKEDLLIIMSSSKLSDSKNLLDFEQPADWWK